MIRFKTGDILAEDVEALVNAVNCVGVMGRGVALQFKKAFPENFKSYSAACKRKEVKPGRMFVFETGALAPRYIVNFPTKRHWRTNSRMEDVEAGLDALVAEIEARNIRSIAIPPLACGSGGLAWDDVRPRIQAALSGLVDLRVTVFEPDAAPVAKDRARMRKPPEMTPGRAALVGLLRRYLDAMLDPFVTLLEAHKLMYFLQEAGEPLRLRYAKAPHGPYADNLQRVLNEIEGHIVSSDADGGGDPEMPLELVPGAIEDAEAVLKRESETQTRFERVTELIYGFESSFGLELLATVHWVMTREIARPTSEVVARTHNWHRSKMRFTPRQIALASTRLREKGWVAAAPPVT